MAFELGFLVGSLLLLALVVYFTRFRGPSLPHETATSDGDAAESGSMEGDAGPTRPPRGGHATALETCDICGEARDCRTVGDLTVCRQCDDDLL